MQPYRILLVDDNPAFLTILTRLLNADPQIEIVGWAASGNEALHLVELLRPHLVLMDIALPDPTLNGLETTRQIKARVAAPQVIILTFHALPEYRTAALEAGADAFVAKPAAAIELLQFIHAVADRCPIAGHF